MKNMDEQIKEIRYKQIDSLISKQITETALISKKTRWYEMVLAASFGGALVTLGVAIAKLFL